MNIYAEYGHRVRFTGKDGYPFQNEHARKVLIVDGIYTISHTDVHSSSTSIWLIERPGQSFNSVMFEDYVEDVIEDYTPPAVVPVSTSYDSNNYGSIGAIPSWSEPDLTYRESTKEAHDAFVETRNEEICRREPDPEPTYTPSESACDSSSSDSGSSSSSDD